MKLRNSLHRWVDANGASFLIDYPNANQQSMLDELRIETFGGLESQIVSEADKTKDIKIDMSKIKVSKFQDWKRLTLKYTIKGWKGVTYEDGTEVPCEIVNDELEDSLWNKLVGDTEQMEFLFRLINAEISFTENDKKKL